MSGPLTNVIHLFRSLLRECTYIPYPTVQSYFQEHVLASFRRYIPRNRKEPDITYQRKSRLLQRGRKLHSILSRANAGSHKPMAKLLSLTYGRSGKRRHELMEQLGLADLEKENETQTMNQKKIDVGWKPPPAFAAVLKSNVMHQEYIDLYKAKVSDKPEIPVLNTWGKPMPRSRIRNTTKRWLVKMEKRIVLPLPQPEVDEIRALVTGLQALHPPKARRAKAKSTITSHEGKGADIISDPPRRPARRLVSPKKITTRSLRRKLARVVLKHSPVAETTKDSKRIILRWPEHSRTRLAAMKLNNNEQCKLLFGD